MESNIINQKKSETAYGRSFFKLGKEEKEKSRLILESFLQDEEILNNSDNRIVTTQIYLNDILNEAKIDDRIIQRLISLDENMSKQTFQYLLLSASNLSDESFEDGIRKLVFHVDFCKTNWHALQRFTTGSLPNEIFDINNYNQEWFQRIISTIGVTRGLDYEFVSQLIRHRGLSEKGENTIKNTSKIFDKYSGYFQDQYLTSESGLSKVPRQKKKEFEKELLKKGNNITHTLIETIMKICEEDSEFLHGRLEDSIVILQFHMEEEFSRMNFKEKIRIIQFLINILDSSRFVLESEEKWEGNVEKFWNIILGLKGEKEISFKNAVEISRKGPGILCKFESIEDTKKVFPNEFKEQQNDTIASLHNHSLANGYELFQKRIICIIKENLNESDPNQLEEIIIHELFHIYQLFLTPIFKMIVDLEEIQIEIKRELSATVIENYEYSNVELEKIALNTANIYRDLGNTSQITEKELKKRISKQVLEIRRVIQNNDSKKSAILLWRYINFDRSKIPS